MRKKFTKGLIIASLLLGLFFLIRACTHSSQSNDDLTSFLMAAGFEDITLPEPVKKGGTLEYTDIALDKDAFSTIGKITIRSGWMGGWKSIEIENIDLTGEIKDGLEISIAGWNRDHVNSKKLNLASHPLLSIKDASIALLSPTVGGIDLKFEAQFRPKGKDWEFQGRLDGAQSQLSYKASANGTLTREGFWQSLIEVEQAKFALGLIKGTRISGQIEISGHSLEDSTILGDLQAGGFNILNLPWENASLTLDGSLAKTGMTISATSAGIEGIEFGLTLESLQTPHIFTGNLHSDFLGTLFDYLDSRKALFIDRKALTPLDKKEVFDIDFTGVYGKLNFEVRENNVTVVNMGEIKPVDAGVSLQGLADDLPFELTLETNEGQLKGTLARSQDKTSLVTLPDGEKISPRLKPTSSIVDIFR